jgi:hypothetical protein
MTRPGNLETALREYRNQVLRWNRQISLVSRQDPEATLDRLVIQCRDGFALLAGEVALESGVAYYDLGSGGGLPGVIWHLLLVERGLDPRTCLVEPREKRAWFLDRLRSVPGMPGFRVAEGRWGETEIAGTGATQILISLKALKLTDPVVVEGLPAETRRRSLIIARYYPPGEPWTPELATDLQISEPGTEVAGGGVRWRAVGTRVLAGDDFSLLLSAYEAPSS